MSHPHRRGSEIHPGRCPPAAEKGTGAGAVHMLPLFKFIDCYIVMLLPILHNKPTAG